MDDESEYITYGTSLPDLEDEFVQRKKTARELEVRDEKGRQRFHGAFTGGFSAGYFNTVGTKEGWTPSTFVSSRNRTAEKVQQNPEDFMDAEDLGEFGITTRRIHTTSQFKDSEEDGRKRKFVELDSVIPGVAPLKDIVRPVSESIGIEILKKLGWRFGQGIGPRVKKQQPSEKKIYGCSLPDALPVEEDDPTSYMFTFAPTDAEGMIYRPKDDHFGLGYTGLSKESVLSSRVDTFNPTSTKTFLKKDKKKLAISGQAFGVGAFEDDDEDIYSKDDMSQYDFSELEGKASKHSEDKKKSSNTSGVIVGFRLATHPPLLKQHYSPPDLPHNYNPVRASSSVQPQAKPPHPPHQRLTADDRSLIMGEKKFQTSQPKDYEKKSEQKSTWQEKLGAALSAAKPHVFRPFPTDEVKQCRYELFVKLKELGNTHKLVQPSSMTEWEKEQELEEFERSSMLFKPQPANSMFESKSSLCVEHEVMDALQKAKDDKDKKRSEKKKLVGVSSRTMIEWHPKSLLCKRFNIPNPYPNSGDVPDCQPAKSLFGHIPIPTHSPKHTAQKDIPLSQSLENTTDLLSPQQTSIENVELPVTSNNTSTPPQDTEKKKPPIDFFKDIFEKSSSEDEDEPTEQLPKPSETINSKITAEELKSQNEIRETSDSSTAPSKPESKRIGFGVFANIDLDALNQRTPQSQLSTQSSRPSDSASTVDRLSDPLKSDSEPVCVKKETEDPEVDLYGPALPPDYSECPSATSIHHSKKHSKHKSKHKHKNHKHKSKKKKKKSSHKSSDDSSSEYDDVPNSVIIEKMKKLQKIMKSEL